MQLSSGKDLLDVFAPRTTGVGVERGFGSHDDFGKTISSSVVRVPCDALLDMQISTRTRKLKATTGGDRLLTQPLEVHCVIYARFSSAGQRESSIERQIEKCTEHARSQRWKILQVYQDRARTGSTLFGRAGLEQLLIDAAGHEFSYVVVEQTDRLSRDEADLALVLKRLRRHKVTVFDLAFGTIEGVKRGISGFIAQHNKEQFLARSADGRARGVMKGRSPHRCAYGYVKHPNLVGVRTIHAHRAECVREIFRLCNDKIGMTEIARHITDRYDTPQAASEFDRGIASGRHASWTACAVRHILRNPIYAGMLVDGVTRVVRDEETYEVVGREQKPRSEWRVTDVPELAIVDVAEWTQAQKRLNANYDGNASNAPWTRYLLTGLVFCGRCDQACKVSVNGKAVLRCTHE